MGTIRRGDLIRVNKDKLVMKMGDNVQENFDRVFVVCSNDINNRFCPTVNILCVSSQIQKQNYPMHVLIKRNNYENIKQDSIILAEQIFTINKDNIKRVVGHLNKEDMMELNSAIALQFIGKKNILTCF